MNPLRLSLSSTRPQYLWFLIWGLLGCTYMACKEKAVSLNLVPGWDDQYSHAIADLERSSANVDGKFLIDDAKHTARVFAQLEVRARVLRMVEEQTQAIPIRNAICIEERPGASRNEQSSYRILFYFERVDGEAFVATNRAPGLEGITLGEDPYLFHSHSQFFRREETNKTLQAKKLQSGEYFDKEIMSEGSDSTLFISVYVPMSLGTKQYVLICPPGNDSNTLRAKEAARHLAPLLELVEEIEKSLGLRCK